MNLRDQKSNSDTAKGVVYPKATRVGLTMSTPPVSSLITRGVLRILGIAMPPTCRRQAWDNFENQFLKFNSIDADLFSDLGN
ncbi:MAG: hypothetical protein ACXVB4_19510 [Pseudobdellovibrionaceae bacterium]